MALKPEAERYGSLCTNADHGHGTKDKSTLVMVMHASTPMILTFHAVRYWWLADCFRYSGRPDVPAEHVRLWTTEVLAFIKFSYHLIGAYVNGIEYELVLKINKCTLNTRGVNMNSVSLQYFQIFWVKIASIHIIHVIIRLLNKLCLRKQTLNSTRWYTLTESRWYSSQSHCLLDNLLHEI